MKNFFKARRIGGKIAKNAQAGFTLVEMLIVIAIIAVISALSLYNSSKLNSSVLLSNTAYEVGLVIRDAQISGLGAKVMLTGGIATTSNQGIYVTKSNPSQFIFFADVNNPNRYNVGEESQIYNIENKRAGQILNIYRVSGNYRNEVNDVSVIFKRPNPEAYFYSEGDTNLGPKDPGFQGLVVINMGFPGGECKSIIIYKTGAIQIDKSFCP